MKKILILLLFSVACLSQDFYRGGSSSGGLVGLKDTTDGVVSNGINNFWFGEWRTAYLAPYDMYISSPLIKYSCGEFSNTLALSTVNKSGYLMLSSAFDSVSTGDISNMSPLIDISLVWNNGYGYLLYSHQILNDSSYGITTEGDEYGLHIRPSGQLQSVTENGTENVLTDYGTLSGTVYVKDTNNVIKSLTFTNGLLTASNLGDFAGVFESTETNLTQSNFKQSPDYAEFLEFQKYLIMKKQLAKAGN